MTLSCKAHQKLIKASELLMTEMEMQGLSCSELESISKELSQLFQQNEALQEDLKNILNKYHQQAGLLRKQYRVLKKQLEKNN